MNEIWKDIEDYPDYQASNFGRVKSLFKDHRILKPILANHGYLQVVLYKNKKKKTSTIHRLVAKAFIENPDNKPQINHIDGIKLNNYAYNLEWCTPSENHLHAYKIGLKDQKGEHHSQNKLTEKEVYQIRDLLKYTRLTQTFIAKVFGVNRVTITDLNSGRNWKHI